MPVRPLLAVTSAVALLALVGRDLHAGMHTQALTGLIGSPLTGLIGFNQLFVKGLFIIFV